MGYSAAWGNWFLKKTWCQSWHCPFNTSIVCLSAFFGRWGMSVYLFYLSVLLTWAYMLPVCLPYMSIYCLSVILAWTYEYLLSLVSLTEHICYMSVLLTWSMWSYMLPDCFPCLSIYAACLSSYLSMPYLPEAYLLSVCLKHWGFLDPPLTYACLPICHPNLSISSCLSVFLSSA
jgi:hypothetical protein